MTTLFSDSHKLWSECDCGLKLLGLTSSEVPSRDDRAAFTSFFQQRLKHAEKILKSLLKFSYFKEDAYSALANTRKFIQATTNEDSAQQDKHYCEMLKQPIQLLTWRHHKKPFKPSRSSRPLTPPASPLPGGSGTPTHPPSPLPPRTPPRASHRKHRKSHKHRKSSKSAEATKISKKNTAPPPPPPTSTSSNPNLKNRKPRGPGKNNMAPRAFMTTATIIGDIKDDNWRYEKLGFQAVIQIGKTRDLMWLRHDEIQPQHHEAIKTYLDKLKTEGRSRKLNNILARNIPIIQTILDN